MVNSVFINNNNTPGIFFLQSRYQFISDSTANTEQFQLKSNLLQFEKLKQDTLNDLFYYLDSVLNGNFSVLENNSTSDVFDTIGRLLVDEHHFTSSKSEIIEYQVTNATFDQYKSLVHKIINSLNATKILHETNENFEERIDLLNEYKDILTNRESLKEYIEENYTNFQINFMNVDYEVHELLNLPPEYVTYLNLYGVPENGSFDSERLNNIRRSLGMI